MQIKFVESHYFRTIATFYTTEKRMKNNSLNRTFF